MGAQSLISSPKAGKGDCTVLALSLPCLGHWCEVLWVPREEGSCPPSKPQVRWALRIPYGLINRLTQTFSPVQHDFLVL